MKKIAIIGSGISGLTAAHLLSRKHQVTVFESNDYIGGHTATKTITLDGKTYPIDTGFIVYNDWTYPNFIKLLGQLGVASQPTEMSFSVTCEKTGLEYSGNNLNTLFAQRRNIFKPAYWHFLSEIMRFNREAIRDLDSGSLGSETRLGDYLDHNHYSREFIEHYLVPMGSAIWSASIKDMMAFPLLFFVRFFKNHGLLSVNNRPQWRVISGGSQQYIPALTRNYADQIRLSCRIKSVMRNDKAVAIETAEGVECFDELVFACHSDQALALLGDATADEKSILGAMPYQDNEVVLHTDASILPKRKLAWASWNYHLGKNTDTPAALTYNMNILQGITSDHTFCVTLNNTAAIDPKKIINTFHYSHPVFTRDGMAAQQQWHKINGVKRSWYCGAYWFNGFHEDGVSSAVRVGDAFGESL